MGEIDAGGDLQLFHREMGKRARPDEPYESLSLLAFA
jgi:hypothetical protein